MDKIRIGNDIHIVWSIFRDNQPEVFEGKDVEVRLIHTRTRDVIPLEWVISDGVVSATFYGKDQIDTGDYKLMLVENNGAPNMATIDECKAFTLVQYSCQEQKEEPSTSLQLHKVQLTSYFALSGGGNISVEGYPNVDELEEVKELSGNENIIITDTEGNKKTTIGNLKEYVVKDISELPPFRIFETEQDYNAVKDELGDCVVCLRDTGVMLYHVYNKTEEGGGEIEDKYIRFADAEVQRILVENFSADKVGMTSEDIAKVTSIGTVFNGNTIIETFDEFEKFTSVTMLSSTISNKKTGAFPDCTLLRKITLPDTIRTIGNYTFSGCSSLTEISLPKNIIEIRGNAFYNCTSLNIVLDIDSLSTNLDPGTFEQSGIIGVENLGKITAINGLYQHGAFYKCKSLTFAKLPETLTTIGQHTFGDCTALSQLNLPNAIEKIDSNALYGCTSLEIEDLRLPNLESLGQNAFYGVKIKKISDLGKLTALPTANSSTQNFGDKSVLEEIVLPDTLTSIAEFSFCNYSSLIKIDANWDNITSIDKRAFYQCIQLNIDELKLPKLKTLGTGVFRGCNLHKILDLGEITSIEDSTYYEGTFYQNKKLKAVIFPLSISYIGNNNFVGCTSIKAFIVKALTPPTASSSIFHDTNSTFVIYVPDASVEAYKTATNWSSYASRIKGISELPSDNAELYNEIKDYLS